ncbi:Protein phosphatase 2C 1 [Imshaugia aleurites]|uniref:Protein phosphatase 2C 1 n=1 Tax=Imshaugia aleurites TaxID=172621 RepID=A0A8H3J4G6_9LECA|nr:Protein phosphatase 2C 1 [Imshaugia aleurites]
MFGSSSSPTKEHHESPIASHPAAKPASGPGSIPGGLNLNAVSEDGVDDDGRSSLSSPTGRKSQDDPSHNGEKKRRSSGIAKAGALFSSAKNSFHIHNSPNSTPEDSQLVPQPTAMQKLGKTDPALSVPQGSLNNSAGESRPGPRSTFRVGVTEDKNKKCRRTMEDTHAYLYNFLSTPAPNIGSDSESMSSSMKSQLSKGTQSPSSSLSTSPPPSSHIVETDNGYFAIFDGHAGTFAADWCGKKLHVLLEDMIRKNPNTPVPELLDQTFTNVDQQLDKLPLKNSGCTAICAVLRWEDRIPNSNSATGSTAIAPAAAAAVKAASEPPASDSKSDVAPNPTPQSKAVLPGFASTTTMPKLQNSASRQRVLYTANVGDARIVLCRNGKALRLSYDHKGSDENEGKRISNAGGLILNNRVNGVLAVTRALGDAYMKDLVTGHPYTTETVIQPDIDEFLILACDGLWDVCTDQEAVDLIRHTHDPQHASRLLVDHALARFSTDNLSCMVVRFDNSKLQQTVERKTEPIGVEGDPPSIKAGGISEADAIVGEARKSMSDVGHVLHSDVRPEEGLEEDKARISQEIIREEEEKEVGPEVDPEGLKSMRTR